LPTLPPGNIYSSHKRFHLLHDQSDASEWSILWFSYLDHEPFSKWIRNSIRTLLIMTISYFAAAQFLTLILNSFQPSVWTATVILNSFIPENLTNFFPCLWTIPHRDH
jgi:hypothetical protein